MKPLKIFSTSLFTALSGALMPGPVLAITITAVLQVGLIAPVLIILGHSILELALGGFSNIKSHALQLNHPQMGKLFNHES